MGERGIWKKNCVAKTQQVKIECTFAINNGRIGEICTVSSVDYHE